MARARHCLVTYIYIYVNLDRDSHPLALGAASVRHSDRDSALRASMDSALRASDSISNSLRSALRGYSIH